MRERRHWNGIVRESVRKVNLKRKKEEATREG